MARDEGRLKRLVLDVVHEVWEYWERFHEPRAATTLQPRFTGLVTRALGFDYTVTRMLHWLEEEGFLKLLVRRTGGTWAMPKRVWDAMSSDERAKLQAWIETAEDPYSELRRKRKESRRPG